MYLREDLISDTEASQPLTGHDISLQPEAAQLSLQLFPEQKGPSTDQGSCAVSLASLHMSSWVGVWESGPSSARQHSKGQANVKSWASVSSGCHFYSCGTGQKLMTDFEDCFAF